MKKRFTTLLFVFAAMVLLFATSCTRNYTCQCKFIYTGAPGLPTDSVRTYEIKDTKSGAESKCQAASTSSDMNGIHTEEVCDLF